MSSSPRPPEAHSGSPTPHHAPPQPRPSPARSPAADPLAALGWDARWAAAAVAARAALPGAPSDAAPGRVVAEHRGRYVVAGGDGERSAVVAGRLRHAAATRDDLPAVGDWVLASAAGDGPAMIAAVLPRRSAFRRKTAGALTEPQVAAANVDVAVVVSALPLDLNARRLERYVTLAWESGALPLVVLTKADLCDDLAGALAVAGAAAPGVDVIAISAATGAGLEQLARFLRPASTAVLLGSSGVGKSTLANRLLGHDRQATGGLRADGAGRHTTTHRELVRLADGALLVDTPGLREVQLWAADGGVGGLDAAFDEVAAVAAGCRFGDCAHASEPGCAVRAAVAAGTLDAARVEHWRQLGRELAHLARRQDARATAEERARNKVVHRAMRVQLRHKRG